MRVAAKIPFPVWLVIIPLGVVAFLVVVQGYWILTRTTEQDVRNSVAENLPIGSGSQEIFEFLDEQGWEHSDIREAGSATALQEAGYPPGTTVISAISRKSSRSWLGWADIVVYFILDESNRLDGVIVHEIVTSL